MKFLTLTIFTIVPSLPAAFGTFCAGCCCGLRRPVNNNEMFCQVHIVKWLASKYRLALKRLSLKRLSLKRLSLKLRSWRWRVQSPAQVQSPPALARRWRQALHSWRPPHSGLVQKAVHLFSDVLSDHLVLQSDIRFKVQTNTLRLLTPMCFTYTFRSFRRRFKVLMNKTSPCAATCHGARGFPSSAAAPIPP